MISGEGGEEFRGEKAKESPIVMAQVDCERERGNGVRSTREAGRGAGGGDAE